MCYNNLSCGKCLKDLQNTSLPVGGIIRSRKFISQSASSKLSTRSIRKWDYALFQFITEFQSERHSILLTPIRQNPPSEASKEIHRILWHLEAHCHVHHITSHFNPVPPSHPAPSIWSSHLRLNLQVSSLPIDILNQYATCISNLDFIAIIILDEERKLRSC